MSLSNNVREFKFLKFDSENEEKNKSELIKFEIKKEDNFKYEFDISQDKSEFSPMFVGGKKISLKDREKKIEEYFEKKKKKLEKELNEYYEKKVAEADKVVEDAKSEAEKLKKEKEAEGYKAGFDKGYKDGVEKGFKEEKEKFMHFNSLIEKLANFEKENLLKYNDKIGEIIVDLTKKIIKKEVETFPEKVLMENLKNILHKIVDKSFVKISISPFLYDFLQNNIEQVKNSFNLENVKIEKMEKLEIGDCIVETNYGTYDASISEQIFEMEKLIRGGGETT